MVWQSPSKLGFRQQQSAFVYYLCRYLRRGTVLFGTVPPANNDSSTLGSTPGNCRGRSGRPFIAWACTGGSRARPQSSPSPAELGSGGILKIGFQPAGHATVGNSHFSTTAALELVTRSGICSYELPSDQMHCKSCVQ